MIDPLDPGTLMLELKPKPRPRGRPRSIAKKSRAEIQRDYRRRQRDAAGAVSADLHYLGSGLAKYRAGQWSGDELAAALDTVLANHSGAASPGEQVPDLPVKIHPALRPKRQKNQ